MQISLKDSAYPRSIVKPDSQLAKNDLRQSANVNRNESQVSKHALIKMYLLESLMLTTINSFDKLSIYYFKQAFKRQIINNL